ncbi:GUN4 domain-containing protein [filamentous cyanobacterium LEGE 11480]|uniref:GUN4 domain-containing protein n=1 Tax=Romeriopsis navalis LEGE 11480 TaxID=2777977 RepID=A0A928VLF9_9CYAN|nr:GUN4 domain-containing protein [Romeriopsis navalis]MBE9030726.1 GUN4 domain-containing protein [Romeriopsis navalis LEGE 11480]
MANNWAIVVGVNEYDFLPEASLKFAVSDALAMRSFLCEQVGFPENQVLLCGDGQAGTKKATRPVLRDILLHQLARAREADNLWFFFSGHGLDEHLMPIDGNPKDLHDTAISIHFVTEQLRACKAKNIVLILDMCRNESRDTGRKSLESVEASLRQLVKEREGQQGIITLFSCGRGQSSYELATLQQGAFTYALLEGLKQTSILKDLETYLARRVPELHQKAGKTTRKQVPLVIPEPGWKYEEPILSDYATVVDVSRLKELAINAEWNGDFEKAIQYLKQINLAASDVTDKEQALNRILNLMGQSPPAPTVAPASTAKPNRSSPQPSPAATPSEGIDSIPLESQQGVDYCKLRDLLKARKWEEADQETLAVMLQAANRKSAGWLDSDSLKQFPCKDLRTIDQLWVKASNGHFGFSVQKKIWEECGRPMSLGKDWDRFCNKIGWKSGSSYVNYSDMPKNARDFLKGELPVFFGFVFFGVWGSDEVWFSFLAQRLVNCSTQQS